MISLFYYLNSLLKYKHLNGACNKNQFSRDIFKQTLNNKDKTISKNLMNM